MELEGALRVSQPFRLGFLTHVEGKGDSRSIYQETLELFKAADEMGYDVGWVAEHHFKDLVGRLPSLFPFLAAASQVTRRIRLGTAVAILPFENPLRLAEDAAVVDALSGGRLELGVGSGLDPKEFKAFGVDVSERLQRTTEALQVIKAALRGDALADGDLYLNPPAPTLCDRIWQSGQSVVGAQHVAKAGSGLLLARSIIGPATDEPTDQFQVPAVQAYLDTWRDTWAGSNGKPRIGMSRGIYPARDKKTALAHLRDDVLRVAKTQQERYPPGDSLENYCRRLHIFYGHPEEVAQEMRADKIFPFATDIIVQFSPVIPPLDEAIRILEQMATEVAPALGWQPAKTPAAVSSSTISPSTVQSSPSS
jgi:alkanesulfonate monooxygenase SsuD/methylene tetrahydromethanopterin reductase-like flavin-dependent oxidoreductase (luciferase family)